MDLGPLRPYTWALVLGLLVPVSWILDLVLGPGVVVFVVTGIAIVPLAWFLGLGTEELGKHAGPGIGGLLNATFGNASELIIAIFALASGLTEVVKASLTGSIIGNLLLVLGASMLVGGLRHKSQTFSREASGTQITMLVLAVIGLVMPDLYVLSAALVAVESEILVGSLEPAKTSLGLTDLFVGVIIVAIVGNAAEHGSAVLMAHRNKMELSVAVATTSSTQVALFVAPVLVFISLLFAKPMTLDFEIFELASLVLSTAVVAAVVSDGRSNWYEGALLVMVYAVIAVAFFFHPA